MPKYVYVSGSLTGLPQDSYIRKFYEEIGEAANRVLGPEVAYVPHLHTYPIKNPDVTPEQVYKVDKEKVCGAIAVIAYVGRESFGVGSELEMANVQGIPMYLILENGKNLSRLVRGMENVRDILWYTSQDEALQWIEKKLKELMFK